MLSGVGRTVGSTVRNQYRKTAWKAGKVGAKPLPGARWETRGNSVGAKDIYAQGRRRINMAAGGAGGLWGINAMRSPGSSGRSGSPAPHSLGGTTL